MNRYHSQILSVARIVIGALFMQHGAQKLFGLLGGTSVPLFSIMGFAGIIEFFGGLLIVLGLLTHFAAFLASGEMAVAYFTAHAPHGFWPINNHGEAAVFYCFYFLAMSASGAGVWSLDHFLAARRGHEPAVRHHDEQVPLTDKERASAVVRK